MLNFLQMRKTYILLFLICINLSCKQNITNNDLKNLNGYWEIEYVILPDGSQKEYKMNQIIDYFELKDSLGFRKKVSPQLNGTYLVDDVSERIKIITSDDKKSIQYVTNFAKWNEEIVLISDKELVLKNAQNLEYHYKKPIPFSIK